MSDIAATGLSFMMVAVILEGWLITGALKDIAGELRRIRLAGESTGVAQERDDGRSKG